ncbi:MAG TPA: VCBS repeat-containing protein [Polyangia bacterium]|nr:VCBS repeat-containing protein [Polyangia bacterium]
MLLTANAATGNAPGRKTPPAAPGDTISVCAKEEELVRIELNAGQDEADGAEPIYEVVPASGATSRQTLDRKVDLNGDGRPDLVLADPSQAARDARYLSWFVDCGGGTFYPLLTEYAADYEIGRSAGGWRTISLFNSISPENPSLTFVEKETYRFDGARYRRVKREEVRRRRRSLPVPVHSPPKRLCDAVYCDSEGHCDGPSPPNCKH